MAQGTGSAAWYFTRSAILLLLLFLSERVSANTFDWGEGCEGGGGSFKIDLEKEGEILQVGEKIPKGKWNVNIKLKANVDIDVQLYDTEDISKFEEGKAVVAWCEDGSTCNLGILGSEAGVESAEYKGFQVEYSGYEGVSGSPGKEYIRIDGVTTTELALKVFAFKKGSAIVDYTFDRVQTGCCLGTTACTGNFVTSVPKMGVQDVGIIVTGKKNVEVRIFSESDVDIQLFDASDTSKFSEGKAIVAYCEEDDCNKGTLGNNDGAPEETTYKGLLYKYSGYNGDFSESSSDSSTSRGNEYIKVVGVSNTELKMRVFGFAAGEARVTYSYYEDYDKAGPVEPSVDFLTLSNARQHNTAAYMDVPENVLIVRRGLGFNFVVSHPNGILPSDISFVLRGCVGNKKWTDITDKKSNSFCKEYIYPLDMLETKYNTQGGSVTTTIMPKNEAPIGRYELTVETRKSGTAYFNKIDVVILLNPYDTDDQVSQSAQNRREYVENTKSLIWQGLSDNNNGFTWDVDHYNYKNLDVGLDLLRRMPIEDRADPVLVSRHITYAVGKDMCYGKWGEGSYTTGTFGYKCDENKDWTLDDVIAGKKAKCHEPTHWRGTTELVDMYLAVQKPVQFCQCFVYAGVTLTMVRTLGFAGRIVSNFQSAHDTDWNRAIEKYYKIDDSDMFTPVENGPSTDSVWSFHVWNEVYMKRPALNKDLSCKTCADGWQAIDATPQEYSSGGSATPNDEYQMGPASVRLLKRNVDKKWDNEFVISEVNADLNIWVVDDDAPGGYKLYLSSQKNPWDDYSTIGQQISTKKKGEISEECSRPTWPRDCSKELDDITRFYKSPEPSSGGDPTDPSKGPCHAQNPPTCGRNGRLLRSDKRYAIFNSVSEIREFSGTTNLVVTHGIVPDRSQPIVNLNGHHANTMQVVSNVTNEGTNSITIYCKHTTTVRDYTSHVIAMVDTTTSTHTLNPGQSVECRYAASRELYREFARNFLDVSEGQWGEGLEEMDPSEKAYMLRIETDITVNHEDSNELFDSHISEKIICTPQVHLRDRIVCEDARGQYVVPDVVEESVAHLTKSACEAVGASMSTVNDGVCNENNNIEGCYDGGDCCSYSCTVKNGHFIELTDDGFEYSHECFSLNDSATCIDPNVKDYVPPTDYSDPVDTIPAEDFGESRCETLYEQFIRMVNNSCTNNLQEPVTNECQARINDVWCTDEFAVAQSQCKTYFRTIDKPRCSSTYTVDYQCRCKQSWKFHEQGSDILGVFENESCGNPKGHTYDYHEQDWCEIVEGSCNTITGNPLGVNFRVEGFCQCSENNGCPQDEDSCDKCPLIENKDDCEISNRIWKETHYWGNCGSGFADVNTGQLLGVELVPSLNWSIEEDVDTFLVIENSTRNWKPFDEKVTIPTNSPTTTSNPKPPSFDRFEKKVIFSSTIKQLDARDGKEDLSFQYMVRSTVSKYLQSPISEVIFKDVSSTVQLQPKIEVVIYALDQKQASVYSNALLNISQTTQTRKEYVEYLQGFCGRECQNLNEESLADVSVDIVDNEKPAGSNDELSLSIKILIGSGAFVVVSILSVVARKYYLKHYVIEGQSAPIELNQKAVQGIRNPVYSL